MDLQAIWLWAVVGQISAGILAWLLNWDRFWSDFREAFDNSRGGGDPDGFA